MAGSRRRPKAPEEAFPPGDGMAETDATVVCPYCHQTAHIGLDPGSGPSQAYIEDCPVCCRPWRVAVRYLADGTARVQVEPEDGG